MFIVVENPADQMLREGKSCAVRALLRDMIAGALERMSKPFLRTFRSCTEENQDPTASNACLAQCFHIHPDVEFLHLHTTAGVRNMRDGPGDSGLGPDTDPTQRIQAYNLCVCEPTAWQAT